MNATIANEIYELRDNQYKTFIDLLYDLKDKTSINSKQLKILIELDFFSEFGDANYLIKLYELFDLLVGKVQIKKSKLEEMNISEDVVRKYSAKETDKMFSQVNTKLLMNELAKEKICYQKRTLKEKIEAQRKH